MSNNTGEVLLCIDMSNILHKTFYVHAQTPTEELIPLAYHASLQTLNKYHKLIKPTKTIFVFDRGNWRKAYTQSEVCLSGKLYKGQRRQNMTPSQKKRYEAFQGFINDFEQLMRDHTSIVCLAGDGLEADDLIAGVCQTFTTADKICIVSADKDMMQLLQHSNVQLIDPATGKNRTLADWNHDAKYFLFEKCLRGDLGDNVQSAYPRIRKTRIDEAYADPFKRINMFNETWTNQSSVTFTVKDLFEENRLLMDLSAQPECVRNKIDDVITYEMENSGKYSHFHFLRFLGKYELKNLAKQLENFIPLLSR